MKIPELQTIKDYWLEHHEEFKQIIEIVKSPSDYVNPDTDMISQIFDNAEIYDSFSNWIDCLSYILDSDGHRTRVSFQLWKNQGKWGLVSLGDYFITIF